MLLKVLPRPVASIDATGLFCFWAIPFCVDFFTNVDAWLTLVIIRNGVRIRLAK